MKPQRIQRKRTRGWKMPENTVYVGRPSKWGNPYHVGDADPMIKGHILTPLSAVRMYEWHIENQTKSIECYDETLPPNLDLNELRGKNLACWCKPGEPCHADVLLELANR